MDQEKRLGEKTISKPNYKSLVFFWKSIIFHFTNDPAASFWIPDFDIFIFAFINFQRHKLRVMCKINPLDFLFGCNLSVITYDSYFRNSTLTAIISLHYKCHQQGSSIENIPMSTPNYHYLTIDSYDTSPIMILGFVFT